MPITVRDLVGRRALHLRVAVDGDVDMPVAWVHVTELVDPSRYLRPGDLVLTSGVSLGDPVSAVTFVDALADTGCCALGFGTTPTTPDLPPALVARARERGLSLLHVPESTPFMAVSSAVTEAHVRERERPLTEALARNAQLVASLQHDQGLTGVLRVLHRAIGGAAAVVTADGRLLASVGPRAFAGQALAGAAPTMLDLPSGSGPAARLALSLDLHDDDVAARAVIEQVMAFCMIELQRIRAVRESERRYAAEVFDLLAAGTMLHPAAASRLASLGLDPSRGAVALAAGGETDRTLPLVEEAVARRGLASVVGVRHEQVLVLVQAEAAEERDLVSELVGDLSGAPLGVGGHGSDPSSLAAAVSAARQALTVATRRPDRLAFADDLGSTALLVTLQDPAIVERFRRDLLGPLADHDRRRGSNLIATLAAFLDSGGAYQSTAEHLVIHVNTLRARLARIEQLTGRDLSSMSDRVDFWVAVQAEALGR